MILPESVDNLLKNPGVRFVAAVGFLLLLAGLIASLLVNLADLGGSNFVFDRIWNIRYVDLAAAFLVVGFWIALATTRRFEQPWWILVAVALLAWMLIVAPLSIELPRVFVNLFNLIGLGIRAVGLLAATATLDRAIPKLAPSMAQPQPMAEPQPMAQAQPQAQPQQAGGQAPGWYPDPRQQATWRWWDGATWTENVG